MWHMRGDESFFDMSLKDDEIFFDIQERRAKKFLAKYLSLYDECHDVVSAVVHPSFWPSLNRK